MIFIVVRWPVKPEFADVNVEIPGASGWSSTGEVTPR